MSDINDSKNSPNLSNIYLTIITFSKNVLLNNDYFKNNRKKKGFDSLFKKFVAANDLKTKNASFHSLIKYLDDKNNNVFSYSINDIEYANLEKEIKKYYSEPDEEISSILNEVKVCKNYDRLFKRYATLLNEYYSSGGSTIINYNKEAANKPVVEPTPEPETIIVKEEPKEIKSLVVEKNIVNYDSKTNTNLQNNELTHIRKRLYDLDDNSELTQKEKIRLCDIFKLSNNDTYYGINTVNYSFNINLLLRKINNSEDLLKSMCNISLFCYYVRLNYLKENYIFDRDLITNRLFNLLGANNTIKLYDVAYNLFIRNYNKLDIDVQLKVRNSFKENEFKAYSDLFDIKYFKILSTNEFVSFINKKMIEYAIKEYRLYADVVDNDDCYYNLIHLTSDMNVDDLVNLYFGLKNKMNKEMFKDSNDYKVSELRSIYESNIKRLQEYFSVIIDNKINKYVYDDNYQNRLRRLSKICDLYLREIPRFNRLTISKDDKSLNTINNSYFGSNKMKDAYFKINSKWSRYDSKMEINK